MRNFTGVFTLFLLAIISVSFIYKDSKNLPTVCLSESEMKLFDMINAYRKENKLSKIELSASLSFVAQEHARDLSDNRPAEGKCNMHSWSENGKWKSCCYTKDHKQADCMWQKPKELTKYTGIGFEISHGFPQFQVYNGETVTPESSLNGWKISEGHNNVILNKSTWSKTKWNAIGIGINRDFSCVWFGMVEDTESKPKLCTTE